MSRYLLTPFGSAGDVNPFVWLGRHLQSRGHEVTVITTSLFQEVVEGAGLNFVGLGANEDILKVLAHPDLWKPWSGTGIVFHMAMEYLRPCYQELVSRIEPGRTVLISPFHMFAPRAAREKFQVPLITVHLQPAALLSVHDETTFLPGQEWSARLPVWFKKLLFRLPNPADFHANKPLRAFCREINIPAPRRVLPDWHHSPDGNLLLFPEWFAPRQPDWPHPSLAAGFPMEDLRHQFTLPPELEAFLAAGDKPILFSPGTGNLQAREFFAAGLEACARLGRRALVGTRFPEQLPQPLPPYARHFDYLPFSTVLPRVAALVHHGGIGTLSQAMAAGVPQLIMPMGHDQPDNALRAKKLGIAEDLLPRHFTATNVASALARLTQSPDVAAACARASEHFQHHDAAQRALDWLETRVPS